MESFHLHRIRGKCAVFGFVFCMILLPARAGFTVDVHLQQSAGDTLYLAYYHGQSQYFFDSISLSREGKGVFGGDALTDGIYILMDKKGNTIEFLLSHPRNVKIEGDLASGAMGTRVKGHPESEAFHEYIQIVQATVSASDAILHLDKESAGLSSLEREKIARFEMLEKQVETTRRNLIGKFPGTFLAASLLLLEDPSGDHEHLSFQERYAWMSRDFFSLVDLGRETLLNTPWFFPKMEYYFTRFLKQNPDTLIAAADRLLNTRGIHPAIFQFVLSYLFEWVYEQPNTRYEKVAVHLGTTYYFQGRAPWADKVYLERLQDKLDRVKNCLVGEVAADLVMHNERRKLVSLHAIPAKLTVIYFYDLDCGQCKTATPQLYALHQEYNSQGVEFVAIYTRFHERNWKRFIKANCPGWTNLIDPYHDSNFRNLYDITGTPRVFVLDEQKRILAKNLDYQGLTRILNQLKTVDR